MKTGHGGHDLTDESKAAVFFFACGERERWRC
jgi:hypothetical protein